MQILEPPKTQSYRTVDGHYIKTFLISSKPNAAGWRVSEESLYNKVGSFLGKPFVIIPEHLSSKEQKGHIFANSKDELEQKYREHTHGIIEQISQPYSYNDGTADVFYTATIKLNDSKAASALLENGAKTWIPFAVSPHIWHIGGPEDNITDWEGISLSLVPQGAYGQEAVVNKYCKGDKPACDKSLAAAANMLCKVDDGKAASIIENTLTSLSLNSENKGMAQVIEQPEIKTVQQIPQPIQEEKKQDVISLTKEQHETLLKEKEEKEQLKQQLAQLVNENKNTKLQSIFKSVKDESLKKTLIDKYFNADVNQLNDFYGDVLNHVVPSLVEEAKAQAEQDLKNKTIEDNKSKSKAGSLPKEPQVTEDESKAASIVPKTHNEVLQFDRLMRGEY